MAKVKYTRNIDQVTQLSPDTRRELASVTNKYQFRANDYYLSLIDWDDPDDPIRKIVVPQVAEMEDFGALDASNESANYVAPGCQHKYKDTALLICNEVCGAYCRFCFRKRLFMDDNEEAAIDVRPGIDYISKHPEITNVLMTGGDPLLLSTRRLEKIISKLREIDHVGIIRIGSKMPAFNPFRIIDDPELLEMLARYSTPDKRIYVMAHFNVPQELTPEALKTLDLLHQAGVMTVNQTPLLKTINDDPEVLAELMRRLSFAGCPPYYIFQCRPTMGNQPFELPIVRSYSVFREAKKRLSGLAKRARWVMSHATGKVEMVGLTESHMYMRYHRAKDSVNDERFLIYHRDEKAYWLDDLKPIEHAQAARRYDDNLGRSAAYGLD